MLSARITPRLAESESGFSTHGNATPRAARNGSSLSAMRRKRGTRTPAAARHGIGGGGRIGEIDREQMIGDVALERARLFGGANEIDAQPGGGVDEVLR